MWHASVWTIVIGVLAGCGRVGFAARETDGGGGGGDDAPAGDGPLGDGSVVMQGDVVTIGNRPDATIQGVVFDTFLDVNAPGTNMGVHEDLHVVPAAGQNPTLICFDLSTLRPGVIASATLTLAIVGQPLKATSTMFLYKVYEPWTEGTGDFDPGVSNFTERMVGVGWTNAGASSPTSREGIGTQVAVGPAAIFEPFTMTLAPAMVDGWRNPANGGFVLFAEDSTGTYSEWGSSEYPDTTMRPLLTITFLP